jgi:nitrile hydratase accessory protein
VELEGSIAPPMANGELVFDAPWEGRVFGMARALCEAGHYDWDEFREHLIDEIGAWDQAHDTSESYHYYELFLSALMGLLVEKGIFLVEDVEKLTAELMARPHGHDH